MKALKWLIPVFLFGANAAQAQDSSYRFFMKLPGHTSDVESVAYSFDGKMMASGGWDNRIMVYRADTPGIGQLLFTLEGHFSAITSLAFSRDGKFSTAQIKETDVFFQSSLEKGAAGHGLRLESVLNDRWAGRRP